jgi:hypothetical protein
VPPTQRTANPISHEVEQLLLCCLEKDMTKRPQSARELRARLLALPAATEWTTEAAVNWWDAYDQQPAAANGDGTGESPTSMPTVSVDLASRME